MNALAAQNSVPVATVAAVAYYFNRSAVSAALATGAAIVGARLGVMATPAIRAAVPAALPDIVENNLERVIAAIPAVVGVKYAGGLTWKQSAIVVALSYAALAAVEVARIGEPQPEPGTAVAIPANFADPGNIQTMNA